MPEGILLRPWSQKDDLRLLALHVVLTPTGDIYGSQILQFFTFVLKKEFLVGVEEYISLKSQSAFHLVIKG